MNENSSTKTLEFEDALAMSSYNKYNLDYIKKFLLYNYSNNDLANVYMIENNNSEDIFVIEYSLIIEFDRKYYRVFILVYLPILFPNDPPEFYINKTANVILNKYYLNGKIKPEDFHINLNFFKKFEPSTNNISDIIDNIVINFTLNFPLYKDKSNSNFNNQNKNAKCFFDKSKAYLVKIPTKTLKNFTSVQSNDELREQLNEERKRNKILEDKIKALNNPLNKSEPNNKSENGKIISVLFLTQGNQDIFNYSMACRTTDLFSSLEERLYQDFPKYRNVGKIFMVRAKEILRDKTLEENNIKNNDIISLFPFE